MRLIFEEELNTLNRDMISMGALCEEAIQTAINSLMDQSKDLHGEIQTLVEQINHSEREIENMCLKLLMQQQPVANDLRTISAALKMVSDLERIGDNADDIAEIVELHNIPEKATQNIELKHMADEATEMLSNAINSFVNRDEKLAKKVIEDDDIIDDLFDKLKMDLAGDFGGTNPKVDALLDIFMICKYFERIGDHSVNIAQWVLFMLTGKLEGNTN